MTDPTHTEQAMTDAGTLRQELARVRAELTGCRASLDELAARLVVMTNERDAALETVEKLSAETKWVRRKLGLPEAATEGDVYGQMHILCSNAHGYVAFIKAYKCDDKQGEIARQSVRIGELEAERDALRGLLDRGVERSVADAPCRFVAGGVEVEHWAVRAIARSLRGSLKGAENYVVVDVSDGEGAAVEVTVRKRDGRTPQAKLRQAEAERDAAQEEAARLRALLGECWDKVRSVEASNAGPLQFPVDFDLRDRITAALAGASAPGEDTRDV